MLLDSFCILILASMDWQFSLTLSSLNTYFSSPSLWGLNWDRQDNTTWKLLVRNMRATKKFRCKEEGDSRWIKALNQSETASAHTRACARTWAKQTTQANSGWQALLIQQEIEVLFSWRRWSTNKPLQSNAVYFMSSMFMSSDKWRHVRTRTGTDPIKPSHLFLELEGSLLADPPAVTCRWRRQKESWQIIICIHYRLFCFTDISSLE